MFIQFYTNFNKLEKLVENKRITYYIKNMRTNNFSILKKLDS